MTSNRKLRVGVDVGGTNSDLVVVDPYRLHEPDRGILAWHKSVTTEDISEGIEKAMRTVLDTPLNDIKKEDIVSLTIGTTHFINAVIERDTSRLEKVAVLRLCGPYAESLPPFGDFPDDLEEIINGYIANVDGGSQVDGADIRPLDEEGIRRHCMEIKKLGIHAVAVVATFSNLNNTHELRAEKIIKEEIPGIEVVLSHTISSIGFVERENAAILNASIRRFGRKIISSFVRATRKIGLNCSVLLSQNDGTVLSAKDALEATIRTFCSGATNSMKGAAILCSGDPEVRNHDVIVCDIGGTTTDVGQLLSSGFPRESATYSYVGGVKMNFSMPHVLSVGLGGGSIVRYDNNSVTVGPDSTGADIVTDSILFGGNVTTASDLAVACIVDSDGVEALGNSYNMGDPLAVQNRFDSKSKKLFQDLISQKLELAIDRMKTSPDPIPVIFVGGGSYLAPPVIKGASKVIRPPFYQVANAIGAALAAISADSHEVKILKDEVSEKEQAINNLLDKAKSTAISKGALPESIRVANVVFEAVPYVDNFYSLQVKVVGEVDYSRTLDFTHTAVDISEDSVIPKIPRNAKVSRVETRSFDYASYRPNVHNGEWILSEPDIIFISIGSYILGCGGGGDPNSEAIELKRIIKNGGIIKVLTLDEFDKRTNGQGRAINVGYCGSPVISGERLHANEILEAVKLIERWEARKTDAVFMFEIGGCNGLSALWTAYKRQLPCIDLDLMGRAYPTQWQSLPSVYNNLKGYPFLALADGNGMSLMLTDAIDDVQMENLVRDAMNNNGVQCALVGPSMGIQQMRAETVANPLSLAWRIGRAVKIANLNSDTDNLPSYIIEAAGGALSAKCLFRGKIISFERKLERGYGYGVVVLETLDDEKSKFRIPFKNENIVVYKVEKDGTEIPICSVPDLITLIDQDGSAVGTQDYRYGLLVWVMAFAPSDKWQTPKGIELGGPLGFGKAFEHIKYNPIGEHVPIRTVADEFNQTHT
ncbi:uncharacterized protein Ecym_3002 [Eremothecium cymbalariae DBVPG|uniref:Hydantoinase/oxoprolinase N-terminal domain-containing protein n=1 Tax=Eremothecium cymbalariae (strain CBS 270.75 / DBVPG 7215 / KCTC 17166 / NRRL Y-17582) TaxID=931890 RepID=G8JQV2_ERECY|nr:Hypothetical protein Ecym_3002 [Eremothecium cymbalariae DBVPG\